MSQFYLWPIYLKILILIRTVGWDRERGGREREERKEREREYTSCSVWKVRTTYQKGELGPSHK